MRLLVLAFLVGCPPKDLTTEDSPPADSRPACDPTLQAAASAYPGWQTAGDCELCSAEPCLHLRSALADASPYDVTDLTNFERCHADADVNTPIAEYEGAKAVTAKLQLAIDARFTSLTSVELDAICDAITNSASGPPHPPLPTGDCPEFDPDASGSANASDNIETNGGVCSALADNDFFRFSDDYTLSVPMNLAQSAAATDVCGCWLRTDFIHSNADPDLMWWSVLYSMANFKTATILSAGFCGGAQQQTITVYEMKVKILDATQAGAIAGMLDNSISIQPPSGVILRPTEIKFSQGTQRYTYQVTCTGNACTGSWANGTRPGWTNGCQSWWDLGQATGNITNAFLANNNGFPVGIIDPAVLSQYDEPIPMYQAAADVEGSPPTLTLELAPDADSGE